MALAFAPPDDAELRRTLLALGREAFAAGSGVVRLALLPAPGGGTVSRMAVATRALGAEPDDWRLMLSDEQHPGPGSAPGVKHDGVDFYARARDATLRAGADDALLFDAEDFLVEGARTNVFVLRADGALVTPPLSRGAVAGVAREIILEHVHEAREADIPRAHLDAAREVILVNAVRGAVLAAVIDGRAVGCSADASWTPRLDALLLSDPPPAD
jgi:branched-subunit amino acid aminotransferase/4-amino-4-deoxychorismate lyase